MFRFYVDSTNINVASNILANNHINHIPRKNHIEIPDTKNIEPEDVGELLDEYVLEWDEI